MYTPIIQCHSVTQHSYDGDIVEDFDKSSATHIVEVKVSDDYQSTLNYKSIK